jgi:hypothetical protein
MLFDAKYADLMSGLSNKLDTLNTKCKFYAEPCLARSKQKKTCMAGHTR